MHFHSITGLKFYDDSINIIPLSLIIIIPLAACIIFWIGQELIQYIFVIVLLH